MNYNDIFFCPDATFKIIIVGGSAVGKSSLLRRLKNDTFHINECSTLGIDFIIKTITYNDINIKLQIWDTAGQDKFNSICRSYYRGSHCAILCFDTQNKSSYLNLFKYLEDIEILCGKNCVRILVATKCDKESIVTNKEIEILESKMSTEHQKVKCIETSSLTNFGIENLLENIIKSLCDATNKNLICPNDSVKFIFPQNISLQQTDDKEISVLTIEDNYVRQKKCCNIY